MMRIALVGLGKIARDQHLAAIAATPGVELAAVADPLTRLDGVPCYPGLDALLAAEPGIDAVALCTPPQYRAGLAAQALAAGKHVLLEKPPGSTLAGVQPLLGMARRAGRTLFASWHSHFAPAVEPARAFLAEHAPRTVAVTWKEDVRVWHPGQAWIWEPGGLGVFDMGINALSILTRIVPQPLILTRADLAFPANRAAPIAAELHFTGPSVTASAAFDFDHKGPERREIEAETEAGLLLLAGSGRSLRLGDRIVVDEPKAEYPKLYARFLALCHAGECDFDLSPLVHVADAFTLARRTIVAPFDD